MYWNENSDGHKGHKKVYKLSICRKNSQNIFCKYFKLFGRKQKILEKIKKEVIA